MKQKATLKTIANIAGLSINSVSRALRNSKNISKDTIARVKRIADEVGYSPSVQAQFLRNGSFNVVALVYDNMVNPYYQIMLQIIHKELSNRNIETMIFVDHHSNGHLSEELARKIISYGVKGILTFINPTNEAKKLLEQNYMKIVLIGRDGRDIGIESVFSNDFMGGQVAAQELVKLGGASFAYVTEHSELKINQYRLDGFREELSNLGYLLKDNHVISGNLECGIETQIKDILAKEKIDSIFCFNDIIAFNTIKILSSLGYAVPADINVIGYDNIKSYYPYFIELTSIDGPKEEMAEKAVGFLLSKSEEVRFSCENVSLSNGNTTKSK